MTDRDLIDIICFAIVGFGSGALGFLCGWSARKPGRKQPRDAKGHYVSKKRQKYSIILPVNNESKPVPSVWAEEPSKHDDNNRDIVEEG